MNDPRCRFMVCTDAGGVELTTSHNTPGVMVCEPHSRDLAARFDAGQIIHVTPDGALYVGDLDELLRRPPAA